MSGELFPLVIGTLSDEILNTNLVVDTISTHAFPMGGGAIFMNFQESKAAVTHQRKFGTKWTNMGRTPYENVVFEWF